MTERYPAASVPALALLALYDWLAPDVGRAGEPHAAEARSWIP